MHRCGRMMRAGTGAEVFTVRRSLWAVLMNLLLGVLLAALTVINLVHQIRSGGGWAVSIVFVILALFFLWQGWTQFRDRSPLIEISAAGLRLPSAASEAIPWPRIWNAQPGRGLPAFGGGRVDFLVDAETFNRLKLGQRFMGDIVVKRRGAANAFSVVTPQLEENAAAIFAAVKRYWPPDRRDEDEEEQRADA